jgi:polar amino acid transport system substrate-binding protein
MSLGIFEHTKVVIILIGMLYLYFYKIMKNMKKTAKGFLCIGILASLFLSGCEKVEQNDPQDTVKIAVSPDHFPMTYSDTTSGTEELKGFEIELIKFILDKLGIKYEINSSEFSGIIASLESGNSQIAIASISNTTARSQSVLFSDVYATSNMRIVSKDQIQTTDISSILVGKKIGVQVGTTHSDYIHQFQSENPNCNFEIVLFDNILSLINAFNAGLVDLITVETITKIDDKISVTYFIYDNPDVKIKYSIAINNKNSELRDNINKVLAENQAEIEEMREKYGLTTKIED